MRRIMAVFAVLFVSVVSLGCGARAPTTRYILVPTAPAVYDGEYDNHNFLVDTGTMRISGVIGSLYTIRTEVQFREKEGGRILIRNLEGSGVALFGKYLLTAEHVVDTDEMIVFTPRGSYRIDSEKIGEPKTSLVYQGKRHPLERVVANKNIDAALFRLPKGLVINSFPYRLGNSDELRVGNYVYLIGNPMNFGVNVREGIVSALKAPPVVSEISANAENAFMVSNGLNPGDSGTPVIAIRDGEYELVGISQGSFTRSQRMGWVIRINAIRDFLLSVNIPEDFKKFLKKGR